MADPIVPPTNPPTPPTPPTPDPRDVKIAQLETKLDDLGTQMHDLINTIQEALQPPATPPTPPKQDPTVQSLDVKSRADIVNDIEKRFGYNKLSEEDRKGLRKTVETRLNQWGTSVFTAPVHQLESLLNDAYVLSDLPKAKEQGRLEGLVDARTNDMGALPTMSSTPNDNDAPQLNADQQKLATQWGLNTDKVAGHLKELQETGVITYKPKEQRQAVNPPTPSGTPTPPTPPAPVA